METNSWRRHLTGFLPSQRELDGQRWKEPSLPALSCAYPASRKWVLCSAYLLSDPLLHNISLLILVFQAQWCGGMGILITICTREINVMSQCKLICVSWPTGIFALKSQLFWNTPVAIAHRGCKSAKEEDRWFATSLLARGVWTLSHSPSLCFAYKISCIKSPLCIFVLFFYASEVWQ